jgi:hypothetical protein
LLARKERHADSLSCFRSRFRKRSSAMGNACHGAPIAR